MSKLTRIFLISNLVLLFSSCSYYTLQGEAVEQETITSYTVPYFDNAEKTYVYTARIVVFDHHLEGIFVVKKLGEEHHRIALLSEFGNTLLDMEMEGKEITVHYVMEQLSRRMILNKLKKYFQLLIYPNYTIQKVTRIEDNRVYISNLQGKRIFLRMNANTILREIRQASFFKNKAEIRFYGPEEEADSIYFHSYEIPLEMRFTKRK